MKQIRLLIALLAATIAPVAMANTISVSKTIGANYGGGGQYTAVAHGEIEDVFQTFCIDVDANFHFFQSYNYTTGQTYGVDSKSLKLGTAWLYSEFAFGTLAGYTADATHAAQLQTALWYFQSETIPMNFAAYAIANPYIALANVQLGATAFDASNGAFDVKVIRPTDKKTQQIAQAWLYVNVPDGGTTVVLLGSALLALGLIKRRKVA